MDETDISIFGKKKPQKEKTDMAHSSKKDEDTQAVSSRPDVKVPFRSVPTKDDEYNSNHKKLGIALIFNHKEVRGQEPRKGTSRDRDRVKGALKSLGFDVRTFDELTFEKLSAQLKEVANEDHSDNDCLVVVVMSHGIEGKVFAKDMAYPVERLWTPFLGNNCKSLINKPKMFFIQACRGSKLDKPVSFTPMSRLSAEETTPVNYVIPTTADLLVFYSTFEGHYSFRNVENGAWFIQCLCMVLEEVAATAVEEGIELFRLLTAVNRKVAYEYQSMTTRQETNEMKEMPNFLSTLTKTFYLKIKRKENIENKPN